MKNNPLLILDFDGVIIDGMNEYWISSKKAFLKLPKNNSYKIPLSNNAPAGFQYLRPWVNQGWEMVVLVWLLNQLILFLKM